MENPHIHIYYICDKSYRSLTDVLADGGYFQNDLVSAGHLLHLQSEVGCSDQRIAVAFDNGFDCYYS